MLLKNPPAPYPPPPPGCGCQRSGSRRRSSFPPHDGKDDRPAAGAKRPFLYSSHRHWNDLPYFHRSPELKVGEAKSQLRSLGQGIGLDDQIPADRFLSLGKGSVRDHRLLALYHLTLR